jgi:hypothetical protein
VAPESDLVARVQHARHPPTDVSLWNSTGVVGHLAGSVLESTWWHESIASLDVDAPVEEHSALWMTHRLDIAGSVHHLVAGFDGTASARRLIDAHRAAAAASGRAELDPLGDTGGDDSLALVALPGRPGRSRRSGRAREKWDYTAASGDLAVRLVCWTESGMSDAHLVAGLTARVRELLATSG